MKYYAHTAADNHPRPSDGRGVGGEGWQPLAAHLRAVAELAKKFAQPLRLEAEASSALSYPVITPSAALLGVRA